MALEVIDMATLHTPARRVGGLSLLGWLLHFYHDRRSRRLALLQLEKLDDRALRDIGIDRHDVAALVDREVGRFRPDEFRSRG